MKWFLAAIYSYHDYTKLVFIDFVLFWIEHDLDLCFTRYPSNNIEQNDFVSNRCYRILAKRLKQENQEQEQTTTNKRKHWVRRLKLKVNCFWQHNSSLAEGKTLSTKPMSNVGDPFEDSVKPWPFYWFGSSFEYILYFNCNLRVDK